MSKVHSKVVFTVAKFRPLDPLLPTLLCLLTGRALPLPGLRLLCLLS